MNNFNMPTNKTAADALLKELHKQRVSLSNKMTRVQNDYHQAVAKKDKIDNHIGNLTRTSREIKISLEQIKAQEDAIQARLPQLYNSRSAARNARLKARKSTKK